jgi:hypothetical protein
MQNLNAELSRMLTLMEVKNNSSLPLLYESEQMIANVLGKLDEKTKLKIRQETSTMFDSVMDRIRKCYNPNKYPIIESIAYSSLCVIIVICVIIATDGIGAIAIASICWALQCSMSIFKQVMALDKNSTNYKALVKECGNISKCAGEDFRALGKSFSMMTVGTGPMGMAQTIKDIFTW